MRLVLSILFFLLATTAQAGDFLHGADVSFLPQVEQARTVFRDDGHPAEFFSILKEHGLNTIRLRLWHTPTGGHSGLAETLVLAERAQAAGFEILLDFHYSDTWADPGHQTKPSAWKSLQFAALKDSVRTYTRDVLTAFAQRGVVPEMVQLGNEITPGMLWGDGRVGGSFDNFNKWSQLANLLAAATTGINEALPGARKPEIMIHLDCGGDNQHCRWFFDHLSALECEFDVIGLSYYPWWHGSLHDLQNNLEDLATRYQKDLVVVETAYPWTLGWFDGTHNLVGLPEHQLPGYAATPEGQKAFLEAVLEIVRTVPENRGRGVFWWSPEWIASPGFGSTWENLTLFDEEGNALPALEIFKSYSHGQTPPSTGNGTSIKP